MRKCRLGKDEPFGISWPKQYVTALGIAFPYNVRAGNKINFDERLAKLKKVLNIWSSRNLTILGKIAIVKNLALILTKLLYTYKRLLAVRPLPLQFALAFKRLQYSKQSPRDFSRGHSATLIRQRNRSLLIGGSNNAYKSTKHCQGSMRLKFPAYYNGPIKTPHQNNSALSRMK